MNVPHFKHEFQVGGYDYVAQHPDPETAFTIGVELSKLVGEPVAAMADGAVDPKNLADALRKAANIFLQKLDAKTMFKMVQKVLSYVEVQPNDKTDHKLHLSEANAFKLHFQGRHGDMLECFVQTLVFQQADFFLAIKRTLSTMMSKVKE